MTQRDALSWLIQFERQSVDFLERLQKEFPGDDEHVYIINSRVGYSRDSIRQWIDNILENMLLEENPPK